MDKIEYRAVIKFLFLKQKTNDEIKAELREVNGDSAPSFATIKYWTAEFKRGRTSICDEERPGRLTPEMIEEIHDMVMNDRRLKVREIGEAVGTSIERVQKILNDHLDMRKLCARWVPRLLTIDHKHTRVTTSKECLAMLKRNPKDFWRRYITVDETWIHHCTPETKKQSKQWTSRRSSLKQTPILTSWSNRIIQNGSKN